MNSLCQPDYKSRYNHQEKCRRLKELFFAENLPVQSGITVDKNENIVNKNNYYFSKQVFQDNNTLKKETPVKVKAHITGLPQPQIVQKVSFLSNKSKENYTGKMLEAHSGDVPKQSPIAVNPISSSPKSYLRGKMFFDDARNMNLKDNESSLIKTKRAVLAANQDTNTSSDAFSHSHSKYESSFLKAKRIALANEDAKTCNAIDGVRLNHSKGESPFVKAKGVALASNEDTKCLDGVNCNHSKNDKCFDVKMLQSFSVHSNQNEKNHCVPTFPRSYLHPSIQTTPLMQKKDRTHSGHLVLESDFLIDDEIADQPSLITFEKNREGAKTYARRQDRAKESKTDGISVKCSNGRRTWLGDQPNQTSDSYYYIYNQLVPDVRSIKSSVLHLKRVLCQTEIMNPFDPKRIQNTFYHQLAEADQPHSQENCGSENHLEELADMRRQVVFLEEQLRDKDRVISNLQRQASGMADISKRKETCSKATQT